MVMSESGIVGVVSKRRADATLPLREKDLREPSIS
jgi:hypothetical protein